MSKFILSIDQGTTSSKAILFNAKGQVVCQAQQEFKQAFPNDGWVEQDGEDIWATSCSVSRKVIDDFKNTSGSLSDILGVGITNQRETTLLWDKSTGRCLYPAIVWQDRRTAVRCQELKQAGYESTIRKKTGLLLDPYFSASKLSWLLDNVPGARKQAESGKLAFGTVDSFLLWRMTDGKKHLTDASNASRTMLFNIHQQQWDQELLEIFNIPKEILPEVKNSSDDFGNCSKDFIGISLPIAGIAGDQQAALIGQACFKPGMIKSTYGTGCFMMINTGKEVLQSKNKLLSTVAYRINNEVTYAMEGSIFTAGAAIKWLRDGLQLIENAEQTEALAAGISSTGGVYMVPAFTGLGAPYWQPDARGIITGLTFNSDRNAIVRAALESICYQSKDLLDAMVKDGAESPTVMRVDGGMVVNDWLMQFLADMLNVVVDRPQTTETTALGAALLAGLRLGVYESLGDLASVWGHQKSFKPSMPGEERKTLYADWQRAVALVV